MESVTDGTLVDEVKTLNKYSPNMFVYTKHLPCTKPNNNFPQLQRSGPLEAKGIETFPRGGRESKLPVQIMAKKFVPQ